MSDKELVEQIKTQLNICPVSRVGMNESKLVIVFDDGVQLIIESHRDYDTSWLDISLEGKEKDGLIWG